MSSPRHAASCIVWLTILFLATSAQLTEAAEQGRKVKRVLLLGQKPDGHPWSTHEYMSGMRILAECLHPVNNLQTIIVQADEPWNEGPELLDGADGAVLFLSEGAKWLQQDAARLEAFQRLAQRGGGLVVIHWGMGCRDAKYIKEFVNLFGGCHGGPDRRYKVVSVKTDIVNPNHPVVSGIQPFEVKEEFYYTLKFPQPAGSMTPLVQVPVEGKSHTVGWAWDRPGGGRSFGYSGGHFHENWSLEEYRRLITQGILWTLDIPVPKTGLPLKILKKELAQPRPKPKKE